MVSRMHSEEKLLRLIKGAYAAAGDTSLWSVFLEDFADSVKGTFTSLILYDPTALEGNLSAAARVDPSDQEKYNEYFGGIDQFGIYGAHLLTPGRVIQGQQLCPDAILDKSEFCADYLDPLNIFNEMCGVILKTDQLVSIMVTLRSRGAGPFDANEQKLFRTLIPHLQQAVELHRKISQAQMVSQSACEALSQLSLGFFLLDDSGKILMMNSSARLLIAQNDGLRVTRNGLVAVRPEEDRVLRKLIIGASNALTPSIKTLPPGGRMALSRPSLKRPYSVSVSPVPFQASPFLASRAAVGVFVADPEVIPEPDTDMLCRLYELTMAEARVAAMLIQGKSLANTCEELSILPNTARTHLKHIFQKLGVRRQGELVSILLRSMPSLRSPATSL